MSWGPSVLELIAGALVAGLVLLDLFQSVVLPRPSVYKQWQTSVVVLRILWRLWRWIGSAWRRPDGRENVLALFGPVALIIQLFIWAASLGLGFALLLASVGDQVRPPLRNFGDALYFSATTLVPLSYGDVLPAGGLARAFVIGESAAGVILIALVISLLFSLYGSFQVREQLVLKLDALAGAPPSGVHLLEHVAKYRMTTRLEATFDEWTTWTAEVLESHLAYPILLYFRSSHDNEAWINSFGAVMDAAALLTSTVEGAATGSARLMLTLGMHMTEDFSRYFRIRVPEYVGIERAEFETAREHLLKAGYQLVARDASWEQFAAFRSRYAPVLNQLARSMSVVPAAWIGDRSYLPHRRAPRRRRATSVPGPR